jgi:predicted transglutaminase-like cysteine proteinase
MNKIKGIVTACIVLAGLFGAAASQAQSTAALPAPSAGAAVAGDARPLVGWITFCERHPGECALDTGEPSTIALTPRAWQAIVSVNRKVNGSVKAITDQEHWGTPDRWDFPSDGLGDCEDFQLLKRKLLAEAGLPRRAMRITVVIDDKGEGHAVLMIRTDRGDFVLDNKTSAVLPWHQTGYIYVKREGENGPTWVSLGGATSPTVTANR